MDTVKKEVVIDENGRIEAEIEPGKVMILIIDGTQGKVTAVEAVRHGMTSVETVKGRATQVHYDSKELL
ncbi:XtrA/YqaO family protein [Aneurinibacillus sp. Ricciae_BoGa-3]|uniref:XtrA/YqaO family protein n=1 Tax=Aneurinibacillus sp. Ricciae_BoGa-3 TaxID=3022697 RepID=UPI002341500C|nr:XtrA/YqaO family protein [Aneurinibacillus sp. Ricciae_BoGa-3]WCK55409.1 XtrA/YqaO family protein [Aneurinibacillus sp. Ricciae_BoGa-3]